MMMHSKAGYITLVTLFLTTKSTISNEKVCPAGTQPKGDGCEPCPDGTFNDSGHRKCSHLMRCDGYNMVTIFNGSKSRDRVCGCIQGYLMSSAVHKCYKDISVDTSTIVETTPDSTDSPEEHSDYVLPVVISIVIIIIIIIVIIARKRIKDIINKITRSCICPYEPVEVIEPDPPATCQLWEAGYNHQPNILSQDVRLTNKLNQAESDLNENVRPRKLWPHLRKYQVMDESNIENCRSERTDEKQVEAIIGFLRRDQVWKIHAFFRCLAHINQDFIIDMVLGKGEKEKYNKNLGKN